MNEIEAKSKIKHRIAVVKEIAGTRFDRKIVEDLEIAIQALKEIREYRELGTVEELKALKEKNEPKKPIMATNMMLKNRDFICPNCEIKMPLKFKYCNHCGQKIDWEGGAE